MFTAVVELKSTGDGENLLYVRISDFWSPIVITEATRLRTAGGRPLSLDDIAVGATVEVRADWSDAGFVADTVTLTESEQVTAVGVVDALEADRVTVSGIAFALDERTEGRADLSGPGQIVAVRGTVDAAGLLVAAQVDSQQAVRLYGKIESLDASARTLKVAGKTVVVTSSTSITEPGKGKLAFGDLKVGQLVSVTGKSGASGIVASNIKLIEANSRVEIVGKVTAFDAASVTVDSRGTSFKLKIDGKTEIRGTLWVGASVNISALLESDGSLRAERIVVAGPKDGSAHLEGAIEAIGASSLTVKGTKVVVDGKTQIRSGSTTIKLADLKVGDRVEVSGTRQADGSILAASIHVDGGKKPSPRAEVEGTIESLGKNTLTVRGVKVTVDAATEIRFHGKAITFADLAKGDRVHVSGTRQADNSVLAERIELQGK